MNIEAEERNLKHGTRIEVYEMRQRKLEYTRFVIISTRLSLRVPF